VSASVGPNSQTAMIHATITGLEKEPVDEKSLGPDGRIAIESANDETRRASVH
jgi:hypothetical protein